MNTRKPFLGLLQRRQCIVPTWRGWLLFFLVLGVAGILVVRGIYGFLEVNDPLPGGILVIEGWSSDYVIEGAVDEYRQGRYERICLTGGPIEFGNAMREHRTYAEYAKALCLKLGVPAEALAAIPAPAVERDRSYASAVALRQWLRDHGAMDAKINIAGNGAHSRRTRLVYEKAFGPGVRIGISNIGEKNFDPKAWWKTSEGFRNVIDETIAYAYARLFFAAEAAAMNRGWITTAQFAAFGAAETNAHRLFSGADGWVERLADDALISHKSAAALDAMRAELAEWSAANGWQPRRIFGKLLPRQNEDRDPPVLLSGDSTLPLTGEVRENGVRYALDFAAGYSVGLFLDQRMNRAFLLGNSPKRLLNTFVYTCSFSVVAALAGAETVSIDLSKKSLDRGRANFVLNNLDPNSGHRFLADDVLEVLPRLARRGEKFDAIVLDPPTFSRGNKGRRWQVGQHLEDLVIAAMEAATPAAHILISTNCATIQIADMERVARFALKFHRLPGDLRREAQSPDFPPGHGAKTLWVSLRG